MQYRKLYLRNEVGVGGGREEGNTYLPFKWEKRLQNLRMYSVQLHVIFLKKSVTYTDYTVTELPELF